MKSKKPGQAKKPFDPFEYYSKSVQSPDADLDFLETVYKTYFKKNLRVLSEDFCAAYLNCCTWVKRDTKNIAIAVDLDREPLKYGRDHYESSLSDDEKKRLQVLHKDVLDPKLPKTEVIAALNFSYFIFKERQKLKDYFANCFKRLNNQGVLVLDCFGGSDCYSPNENETVHDDFSYFWDQDSFNAVTGEAMFYIHFKRKGEKKREKVFSYDWRVWTLPEIKDILKEVGFNDSIVYWEGTSKDGEGNGVFKPTLRGEDCESWIAYIVAVKNKK